MNTYYFTYGSNHEDRNGHSLGRAFTPIEAEDEESARNKMFELRGDEWSFCYSSRDQFGIEKFGLYEVNAEQIDTREQRKEAAIEEVVSEARRNLQARLASLDAIKEVIRKLPVELISSCREFNCTLDIDNLTREQAVVALSALNAGKWQKSINSIDDGTLDYSGKVDGVNVRLWAAGAPESCRVVEVEEVIPEQRIIKRKLICTPA